MREHTPGMKKKVFVYTLLSAVVPVMLGALAYCCFRPDTYITHMARRLGMPVLDAGISGSAAAVFFRNFFPDIAWAYALPNALFLASGADREKTVLIAVITALMAVTGEILQFCGIISGTGDPADIILELCTACIAIVVIKKRALEE